MTTSAHASGDGGTTSGPQTAALQARWAQAMLPTYPVPPVALARGAGAVVWDVDGHPYLDLLAGIAVNSLGHAHPAFLAAVTDQLATLGHTSNLYASEPSVTLAERLLDLAAARGTGRVFFTNSGAEAVECALKIARRHGAEHATTGTPRTEIVAAEASFHGRTLGALSVTGNTAKREPFAPLPGPVTFVPYGDLEALTAAVGPQTAAVILEPVLGEAGVIAPPAGYLAAARAHTAEQGALFILDEVQAGIGRTGSWLSYQHDTPDLDPDVVTLAKGLGGGLPIGACVARTAPATGALVVGQHGSTFGGNPVCSAGALAVLDTIETQGLLDNAVKVGGHLADGLRTLGHPLVGSGTGLGLWIGVGLTSPVAPAVEAAARDAGFLLNAAAPTRLRLAPPLVLTYDQADSFLAAAPAIFDAARA